MRANTVEAFLIALASVMAVRSEWRRTRSFLGHWHSNNCDVVTMFPSRSVV